ncbi:MAG TPA: zinc ribbon domain-containing protein [Candidatus Brocadiia bacterium]|nr:zinc ribbon domain-containing protein [Candidatus Brocadiia bacterium]
MPLKKCPDCNQDVSVRAETCPHCGAPLKFTFLFSRIFATSILSGCLLVAFGYLGIMILTVWIVNKEMNELEKDPELRQGFLEQMRTEREKIERNDKDKPNSETTPEAEGDSTNE